MKVEEDTHRSKSEDCCFLFRDCVDCEEDVRGSVASLFRWVSRSPTDFSHFLRTSLTVSIHVAVFMAIPMRFMRYLSPGPPRAI